MIVRLASGIPLITGFRGEIFAENPSMITSTSIQGTAVNNLAEVRTPLVLQKRCVQVCFKKKGFAHTIQRWAFDVELSEAFPLLSWVTSFFLYIL
jgi:hypothetical protein